MVSHAKTDLAATVTNPELSWLEIEGHPSIACRIRPGRSPTLLFLPGYASDMDGAKAQALDCFARDRGIGMVRFDYSGTGLSEGRFEDGTLERWLAQTLWVVDHETSGPLVVAGSSMGGWLALHVALLRPERVRAVVGIAAAPDFTDWGFDDAQKAAIERDGRLVIDPDAAAPRAVCVDFWRSGQALRLLGDAIEVHCPVRLVHGEVDQEVPVAIALRLLAQLRSADVQLNIVKGSGHRLSEPHEIDTILRTVEALLEHDR